MAATGDKIHALASRHVGEKDVFGVLVPKDNKELEGSLGLRRVRLLARLLER